MTEFATFAAENLATQWRSTHSEDARVLEDGSVAGLKEQGGNLVICLGVYDRGHEYEFHYADHGRARYEFEKVRGENDVPPGWISNSYG